MHQDREDLPQRVVGNVFVMRTQDKENVQPCVRGEHVTPPAVLRGHVQRSVYHHGKIPADAYVDEALDHLFHNL